MHCLSRRAALALIAALVPAAVSAPALAQTTSDVRFAPGNSGATVSGTVIGQEYIDYRLGARAGQEMLAVLRVTGTNGDGNAFFNILPPGSDGVAIFIGSTEGDTARLQLPQDGTYTVRVYLMGNDADTGKTTGFELDLSIR